MAWGTDVVVVRESLAAFGAAFSQGCLVGYRHQDSPKSDRLTAPIYPESTRTSAARHLPARTLVSCLVGVSADYSGQSEYRICGVYSTNEVCIATNIDGVANTASFFLRAVIDHR
jgi:hypothetical protein